MKIQKLVFLGKDGNIESTKWVHRKPDVVEVNKNIKKLGRLKKYYKIIKRPIFYVNFYVTILDVTIFDVPIFDVTGYQRFFIKKN